MHHVHGSPCLPGERRDTMDCFGFDKGRSRIVPSGQASFAFGVRCHEAAAQDPGHLDVLAVGAKNALAFSNRLSQAEQEAVIDIG